MIKVTLELCPSGDERPESRELLGTIYIVNDMVGTLQSGGMRGNYTYEIEKKRKGRTVLAGRIENFPRLSYHPWNMVRRILNQAAEANGGNI